MSDFSYELPNEDGFFNAVMSGCHFVVIKISIT